MINNIDILKYDPLELEPVEEMFKQLNPKAFYLQEIDNKIEWLSNLDEYEVEMTATYEYMDSLRKFRAERKLKGNKNCIVPFNNYS